MFYARCSGAALAVCAVLGLSAVDASAATITIRSLGEYGWRSDDTRNAQGTNLVGINFTNAPMPGVTPSAEHDALIAQQIQFVEGPAGSTYGGAVSISGTTSNSGKSTISVINPTTGFAAASDLLSEDFYATYQWYGQPNPTSRTLGFRLGIQSTQFAQSQSGFTATHSGESAWDLIFVHVPAKSDNAWSTVSVDRNTGTWVLYRQANNSYLPVTSSSDARTLQEWAEDETFGELLFGEGAKVTSIQFGLGSSQANAIAYLDYVQTNLLNNGDVIDFVAVPEPATAGLALMAGGAWLLRRQRRH